MALVETLLPAAIFAGVLLAGKSNEITGSARRRIAAAATVGTLLFVGVAVPWFAYVLHAVPGVVRTWQTEVGREGATTLDAGSPLGYVRLPLLTTPWLVFGGLGLLCLWARRRERAAWLPIIFAVAPLLVMVWFRDRKERYMLPMIGPAAVVCGYGVATWAKSWRTRPTRGDAAILAGHAIIVLGLAGGFIVAAATFVKRLDGTAWFTRPLAGWAAVALIAFAGAAAVLQRRHVWATPAATVVVLLAILAGYLFGYRDSDHGRAALKPMAETILAQAPGAVVFDWLPRGRVDVASLITSSSLPSKANATPPRRCPTPGGC